MKRWQCVLAGFMMVCFAFSLQAAGDPWSIDSQVLENGTHQEQSSAVAYNFESDNFMVVWQDNRSGNWDIYGAVVSADGSVIQNKFPICTDTSDQYRPDIAYNRVDEEFLVVWHDWRMGEADIYGILLDGNGNKIQSGNNKETSDTSFVISDADTNQFHAKIAHNYLQNTYLVVWHDDRETYTSIYSRDIYAQRLNDDGALLSPFDTINSANNYPIAKMDYQEHSPDVAYHAGTADFEIDEWVVVWVQDSWDINRNASRILGTRIDGKTGIPLRTWGDPYGPQSLPKPSVSTGSNMEDFYIGYTGHGSLWMWESGYQGSPHIFSNDVWPDPTGVVKSNAAMDVYPIPEFLVAWTDFRNFMEMPFENGDIYCQRLAYFPDSTAFRLEFKTLRGDDSLKTLILLDEQGDWVDSAFQWITWPNIPVCLDTNSQVWSDLTFNQVDSEFVVGWNDWRDQPTGAPDEADIFAQRIYIDPKDSALVFRALDGSTQSDRVTNITVKNGHVDEGNANYPGLAHGVMQNKSLITYDYDMNVNGANIDLWGSFLSGTVPVSIGPTKNLPVSFRVSQNYPNPFNPSTTIDFVMPQAGNVKVIVYDALGRQVARVLDEHLNAGPAQIRWEPPSEIASGIYFYRVETDRYMATRKMLLLR